MQALKDTENSLRDFLVMLLQDKYGNEWLKHCGASEDRVQIWQKRKDEEEKKHGAGVADERIIYYADFYDLKTILKRNWNLLSPALGDWKSMEVYLSEMDKYRDSMAHSRELLPYQKHIILGISGEIRSKIVQYRGKGENSENYYPRFESARDNLGNIWIPGKDTWVKSNIKVRPKDELQFIVTATDPFGEEIEYQMTANSGSPSHSEKWGTKNDFKLIIKDSDVCNLFFVNLLIRSKRKYHARKTYDDSLYFTYTVLPPKKKG
jgi:hypothetical protein